MYYDVIIVGSGIAGLHSALQIDQKLKVLILTKNKRDVSNSNLAQGGISVLRDKSDFDEYFEDTLRAGRYENNKEAVVCLIKESREAIESLIEYGVDFNRKGEKLRYTREGAHRTNRIVYHNDITGHEVVRKLLDEVDKRDNIEIKEWKKVVDLITRENECNGVVVLEDCGNLKNLYSKSVILATGGIGGLFKDSTNHRFITGDALSIAINKDIEVKNMDYIQIHPTVLYSEDSKDRRFLISESVRGEGARLFNTLGESFVDELEPRDVVTKAINGQIRKSKNDFVYLDASKMGAEFLKERFPNIVKRCLEEGQDILNGPIKVKPAQHYFMGGIKVNLNGRTRVRGLYAAGETACTGVHGRNRLASNSLLEGLVFSNRIAKDINKNMDKVGLKKYDYVGVNNVDERVVINQIQEGENNFGDEWFRF